jgi:pimeloyl-ACP methyl ester carboxylesterase
MKARTGTISAGDAALFYREMGAGTPLLLIHGTGANSSAFDVALALFAESHRAIGYDRRGYGSSGSRPAPRKGYLRRQADDAAAVLQQLNAAPASVVGVSSGGIIALCLALEYPQLVSRLVLWEPPLHVVRRMPLANRWTLLHALLLSALGRKRQAVATFLRMTLALPDGRNGFDLADDETREKVLLDSATMLHELGTGTGEELEAHRIQTLHCPISAIVGGESMPLFGEAVERLRRLLPQMHVTRVPGAHHVSPMLEPAEFARIALQA